MGTSASKHEIESAFSKYGTLRNVWVARNPPGFAFVEYQDNRDAEDAVRALDGTRVCGTRIRVEMSSGRTRKDEGRGGSGRGSRRDDRGRRDRGRDRFDKLFTLASLITLLIISIFNESWKFWVRSSGKSRGRFLGKFELFPLFRVELVTNIQIIVTSGDFSLHCRQIFLP